MLEVREGRKGLRKPSAFQHQVTLKPHLHLDIEDQRNENKQTNKQTKHKQKVSADNVNS